MIRTLWRWKWNTKTSPNLALSAKIFGHNMYKCPKSNFYNGCPEEKSPGAEPSSKPSMEHKSVENEESHNLAFALAMSRAFPAVIIPESIPSLDPRKFGASAEYHAPLQAHTASMPPSPSSAPTSPKSLPIRTINRLLLTLMRRLVEVLLTFGLSLNLLAFNNWLSYPDEGFEGNIFTWRNDHKRSPRIWAG
ncbi:hypothetical protein L1987_46081 [Smallanthus sonchifolius]|uniref:Uncharacterized protein n=1 Tax=Smallanthus sonchifolius TaxID=185202 RepID=A0ACB9FZQ6_9ASTR|nr:hypothetical protein L1987_46081 [Smallanthus sonchifolius]